jgi:hypothetical protein
MLAASKTKFGRNGKFFEVSTDHLIGLMAGGIQIQLYRTGILNVRSVLMILVKQHFIQASAVEHFPAEKHRSSFFRMKRVKAFDLLR